jgi:hypothetical protein
MAGQKIHLSRLLRLPHEIAQRYLTGVKSVVIFLKMV